MWQTFFFRIGEIVFGTNFVATVLSFIISLGPLPTLFAAKYNTFEKKTKIGVWTIECLIIVFLLYCGSVYSSNFRFPDTIIASLYSSAEETLLNATDHACKIDYAEGYAGQNNSYVFEAVLTDTGETLSPGDILKNTVSITLYTTYDSSKVADYQSGAITLEQMKDVVLEKIAATNVWGSYFVGDKVEKYNLKVVAYYSDNSERELDSEEYDITTETVLSQSGDNIITLSFTEGGVTVTYDLTVVAEEAVLTGITVKYIGMDLLEEEEIDPADLYVVASYSDGREYSISEGQFEYEPKTVMVGSNTVTVTYGGKKATCKITAYGKDENRPIDEVESNDTFDSATKITSPSTITGKIADSTDVDIYEITLSESGVLSIGVNSEMEYTAIYVYKSSSSEAIWYSDDNRYDSSVGIWKKTFTLDLSKGTYKIKVTGQQYGDSESTTGAYSLAIQFDSAGCTESGGHTSLDTAQEISVDCEIKDQISLTERNKFYCFEVTENIQITFKTTSYMNYISWWFYPETETDSFYSVVNAEKTESLEKAINTYTVYLNPGIYYLRVSGREGSTDAADTGIFLFSMSSAVCPVSDTDQFTGSTINGMVASNENSAQYSLTTVADGTINLTFNTDENARIEILTTNGTRVWDGSADSSNYYFEEIALETGNYYVVIYRQNDGGIAFGMSFVFVENAKEE